jgi:fructokinase
MSAAMRAGGTRDTPPPPAAGNAARVLCFGEALVDRIGPPAGAVTPVDGAGCEDHLGGAPANVACGLARLGTAAAFLGRLGEDGIGAEFRRLFEARGVDTTALQWDDLRPSRIVRVHRNAMGDRSFGGFVGDRGEGFADQAVAAGPLTAAANPLLAQARWLLVGTIPLASQGSALALARLTGASLERGVSLALDVNWRPTFWGMAPDAAPSPQALERIRPLLEQAALIKCAAEEARWLFATEDPLAIQTSLPRRPAVLITDGPRPLQWSLGGHSGSLAAFPVEAVDTTGAGDAFTAGLLDGLCRQPDLLGHEAGSPPADLDTVLGTLRFASACGALVCRAAGAIEPQPTRQEVMAFLAD